MIFRKWTGRIRTADQAEYIAYIERTSGDHYLSTPGNLGYQILVRDLDGATSEISTISWWADLDAVRAFAGDDYARASYYPEDDRYLLDRPEFVEHHIVVADGRSPR